MRRSPSYTLSVSGSYPWLHTRAGVAEPGCERRLTQVAKAVYTKKAKCLIMAPNIEQVEGEGGLDDTVAALLAEARGNDTRVVFALTRSKLGALLGPKIRIR
jgi:hypothetical protein